MQSFLCNRGLHHTLKVVHMSGHSFGSDFLSWLRKFPVKQEHLFEERPVRCDCPYFKWGFCKRRLWECRVNHRADVVFDNRDKKYNDIPVKTKSQLKEWVKGWGRYQFRARCEYEFLMALWPFGTRRLKEDIKQFLKSNPDIDNIDDDRKLRNIIIQDMEKIDAYEQIMMNIDIIVDILYDEFLTK